jgi:hypothetical protein
MCQYDLDMWHKIGEFLEGLTKPASCLFHPTSSQSPSPPTDR